MERKEKFETLTKMISMAGLQINEVVAYWQETGQLEKSKDLSGITVLPAKKFVSPETICAGMFVYEDGLIFPEIVEGNQITSVVGYVGKSEGLSVCLKEKKLRWTSGRNVRVGNKLSGKEATRLIVEAALSKGWRADAAQYCFEYAEDGVKAGEAFLASKKELEALYQNKKRINNALGMLQAVLMDKKSYLSSSDCYCYNIYVKDFEDGSWRHIHKYDSYDYVRPVLSFTL